jgi:osmotically-inducible protein OsmY
MARQPPAAILHSPQQTRCDEPKGLTMNTRIKSLVLAAALLSGVAGALPAMAQTSVPMNTSDAALVETVKAALAQSRPLRDADVDIAVTASNGVVHLSGWLTYADDIQTAENIAAAVAGVKDVDTRFRVWSTSGRASNF